MPLNVTIGGQKIRMLRNWQNLPFRLGVAIGFLNFHSHQASFQPPSLNNSKEKSTLLFKKPEKCNYLERIFMLEYRPTSQMDNICRFVKNIFHFTQKYHLDFYNIVADKIKRY